MTAPTFAPPSTRALRLGLAASVLTASLGTSAANVALPAIAQDLGADFAATQWVALAYLLTMTATSLTVGHLGDLIGRRRMLFAGTVLFAVAAVLAAFAPTLGVLIAARALQGVAAAVMMILPLAIARDSASPDRLGAVMGLLGTTAAIGTASGPAIGGLLVSAVGWPAIFAVMVPLGLLAAALTGIPRGDARPDVQGGRGFDAAGVALLTASVAFYTLGVTGVGDSSWTSPALLLLAVLTLAGFLLRERRASHPILPLHLLRSGSLSAGSALNLLVGTVMMSTLVIGPFYLTGAQGLSPAAVGAVMAAGPVASICTGMLAGRMADRFGPSRMIAAGLAGMAIGSLALALLPGIWGLAGYMTGTVLIAPAYQLFLAANSTSALVGVPAERRGAASGLLGLSRNLGLVTGASAMATLFAFATGTSDPSTASAAALGTGLIVTFLVTTALLIAASALSLRRAR